jgi:hypothetical protein
MANRRDSGRPWIGRVLGLVLAAALGAQAASAAAQEEQDELSTDQPTEGLAIWRCKGESLQLYAEEEARKGPIEHVFAVDPATNRVYWWRDERFSPFCSRKKICRTEATERDVKVVYRTADAGEIDVLRINFGTGDWLMVLDGPAATFATMGACHRAKAPFE